MPIKPFKGFARRKSSGNVLEDVEHAPQSSFRVFERPSTGRKSLSDGNLLSQTTGDRPHSYSPPEDDNIFASDGPAYRNLTGGNASEAATSRRFSASNRRSTDLQTHFDSPNPHKNISDVPVPPLTNALRAAGRTFSFGGRFSKTPAQPPPRPSSPDTTHSRSTTSTATPPRLLETEFQIGRMDDDFGSMFNDIGKPDAQQQNHNAKSNNPESSSRRDKSPRPAPISTDRSQNVDPSPYSWGSRHSEEGLLAIADSPDDNIPVYQAYHADQSMVPPPLGARRMSSPMFDAVPANTTGHRSLERPKATNDRGLRRSILFPSKRNTAAVDDEDAKMVTASLNSNKRFGPAHNRMASADFEVDDDVPLFGPSNTVKTISGEREYLPTPGRTNDNVDPTIAVHARLAVEYESKPAPPPSTNKVMTPSQFEHYRQQQELKRANSDASDSEEESAESDFDEEDEAEKNREIERQRRKQEAHMSVYRQQMMKVTGQQAPSPSLRPDERASSSTPNLANLSLHPGHPSGSGKSSEGDADEDEEIPLGILAAHGFPSKNRPPSRLMSSNSMSNLNASYHQPHLGSAGSDYGGGNRNSLPVFAKNLPRDPYFGASLVTPSIRESLALGGGGAGGGGGGSVYGSPPAAAGSSPALPPGGLVGVIATEERARAMRRGSPNTQAMYDHQPKNMGAMGHMGGVPRPHTMLGMNSAPPPNPQPTISATEQAQIQLSQQMSSMMQMQMQWMQQMIQAQGGQAPPQQLASPNFPMPYPPNTNARPSSMPSVGGGMNNGPSGYNSNQRTLSMLDPNVSSRLNSPAGHFVPGANRPVTPNGGGYAPSLAPSERSNVGLAPRYRPVSTIPPEAESGGFLAPSKPWNDENRRSTYLGTPAHASPHNTTIRPVSSYGRASTAPSKLHNHFQAQPDEDDDDEGWANLKQDREKRRANWKIKKETTNFPGEDVMNAVH
ncbi:hypothetical protein BDV19DRAFT_198126 [Aspergillus venezuelensis]